MKLVAACLALLLAGCSGQQVQTQVVEVKVPVPVACIKAVPERPVYRFGIGPKPGEKEAAVLIVQDFEAARQYGVAWEAAAAACVMSAPGGAAQSGTGTPRRN